MTPDEIKFLTEVASRAKDPEMLKSIILWAVSGAKTIGHGWRFKNE